MQKPIIELKNIKYFASISEETNAYTATVYVDGKKYAEASNRGHGASDDFHVEKGAESLISLNERIAATYPKDAQYDLVMDLDLVVGDILEDFIATKNLKSLLSRKIVMLNDKQQLVSLSGKKTPESLKHASAKYPSYIILNNLAVEEAVVLYKQHG